MPKSRNARTGVAAIVDPLGDGVKRHLATVNLRTDLLESERGHKLISEAAYRTGRQVQGLLERATRIGGSNWEGASRGDPGDVRDAHAQRLVDERRAIDALLRRLRDRLGWYDTRLLARVLGEGKSYGDCAALIGRGNDRGQRYIASRVRDALEDLAEAWTAKGKTPPPPDDKHAAAASQAVVREDAALLDGFTLGRLEAELADGGAGRGRDETARLAGQVAAMRARRTSVAARRTRR